MQPFKGHIKIPISNSCILVGFKDVGKTSAAQIFADYGWQTLSFGDSLKDCIASIFCWDRLLVEGTTPQSRAWREEIDSYWAKRLDIPNFSPRYALEYFATDIMRKHFHPDIWILNTEKRAQSFEKVVFVDGRFANEITMVHNMGGKSIRIKRGPEPHWLPHAHLALSGCQYSQAILTKQGIHVSQYAWIKSRLDHTVENNSTIDDLHRAIEQVILS